MPKLTVHSNTKEATLAVSLVPGDLFYFIDPSTDKPARDPHLLTCRHTPSNEPNSSTHTWRGGWKNVNLVNGHYTSYDHHNRIKRLDAGTYLTLSN